MKLPKKPVIFKSLLVAVATCFVFSNIFSVSVKAVPDPAGNLTLTWQQETDYYIQLRAATVYDNHIYSVGMDKTLGSSNAQWYIEKRNLTTGALAIDFGTNGIVAENISDYNDSIEAIAVNASGVYLSGYDSSPGSSDSEWRVEKRDLTTGALITDFDGDGIVTENPSVNLDFISSIALNASGLYLGGYDRSLGSVNAVWRLEKRNPDSGALITDFDGDGIVTENFSIYNDTISSIALDNSGIYIGGNDISLGNGNSQWRVEKQDLTTGALITDFGTDGVITENFSNYTDQIFFISADANGLYVGGPDFALGSSDGEWRLEKRDLTTGDLADNFGTGGTLLQNFDTGNDFPYVLVNNDSSLYVIGYATDVGASSYYSIIQRYSFPEDSTAPVFNNLPGDTVPINITEGQTITTNPYVINVYPTDNIEVAYVQFLVDGVVICTDYTADVNGVYSCSWDTSLYHSSLVQAIAYDTTGNPSNILARNATVDESLYNGLPNTGLSSWFYLLGLVPAILMLVKRIIRQNY